MTTKDLLLNEIERTPKAEFDPARASESVLGKDWLDDRPQFVVHQVLGVAAQRIPGDEARVPPQVMHDLVGPLQGCGEHLNRWEIVGGIAIAIGIVLERVRAHEPVVAVE